ncbi:MAG: hypothetical protein MUF69_09925, partial [Desulfobacterota bacterium]|nr:hypothetical protein [Thermodesulfobacteriota bacterium]
LNRGAVDLDQGLITICDAKGGKTRTAFMAPEVRECSPAGGRGPSAGRTGFPDRGRPRIRRHADHLTGCGYGHGF